MRTRWVAVRNDFSTPVDRVFEYRTRVATPVKGALRRNVTKGQAKVDEGV